MMQFVDSFTCLLSKENNLMVLHLAQNEPFVDFPDGKKQSVSTKTNEVASVILDSKTAIDLCKSIAQLYQCANETAAVNESSQISGERNDIGF